MLGQTSRLLLCLQINSWSDFQTIPDQVSRSSPGQTSRSILGQVGGKMPSLEKHIAALKSMSLFDAMDGKLHEIGNRDSMNMTVNYRRCIDGTTLIPGTNMDSKVDKQLVLLDARNLYETQIGKFKATNAETLDQELRQYSDLASWIFHHSEKLHDKCILMYCTGGIRCETASAYIRSKGVGFENVFQKFPLENFTSLCKLIILRRFSASIIVYSISELRIACHFQQSLSVSYAKKKKWQGKPSNDVTGR
ncbi:hypothetical protein ZIOFF_032106 [Zingiber officinale]|uniref:Rhodanese domain-containing protein n=1 Tax=Zingiber officinale TaxID=94328 RepID=A0A8J5GIK0_ZINOF|nr:hypothetical protein ZIOFF_032106 [Zingiber officinale]